MAAPTMKIRTARIVVIGFSYQITRRMQFSIIVGCNHAMALLDPLLLTLMPVVLDPMETVKAGLLIEPALPPL
jgi:hypothetical protein